GAAACAFGIGAARAMGRFDHAYPLAAQAIVGSWPLPDGTLLGPRVLSNLSDAPYLGEAAVLFALTRKPIRADVAAGRGSLPWLVYAGILFGLSLGAYEALATLRKARRWHKRKAGLSVPFPAAQVVLWWALMISAVLTWFLLSIPIGLILLLTAQLVPFRLKEQSGPAQTPKPSN
ncbi:MAG: hypothetical protein AAB403_14170, partial [Planctomycetota bacterium]